MLFVQMNVNRETDQPVSETWLLKTPRLPFNLPITSHWLPTSFKKSRRSSMRDVCFCKAIEMPM